MRQERETVMETQRQRKATETEERQRPKRVVTSRSAADGVIGTHERGTNENGTDGATFAQVKIKVCVGSCVYMKEKQVREWVCVWFENSKTYGHNGVVNGTEYRLRRKGG